MAESDQKRKTPCIHGTWAGRVIICNRPASETGAWPQSLTVDKRGYIVTEVFCRSICALNTKEKN